MLGGDHPSSRPGTPRETPGPIALAVHTAARTAENLRQDSRETLIYRQTMPGVLLP